jgi:hypothetical protein
MAAADISVSGLENLHEIVLPDPVSWMPQTIGWYVVFGIILLVIGWWGYSRLCRFRANRYRRLALAELAVLEQDLRRPEKRGKALAEIPVLLKGTALSAFPRIDVASLSGDKWLAFLDQSMRGRGFTEGEGRLLTELAYAPSTKISNLPDGTISKLLQLVHLWIKRHVVPLS